MADAGGGSTGEADGNRKEACRGCLGVECDEGEDKDDDDRLRREQQWWRWKNDELKKV